MKKLLFGLIAVVCMSINSFGQSVSVSGVFKNQSVVTVGKLHGIISYLETKEYYTKGMSEKEFVNKIMAYQFDNGVSPDFFKNYLTYIYKLHTLNGDDNKVYDSIDGKAFVDFTNGILKLYNNKMSKEDALMAIYTNGDASKTVKPKNGWLNFARKIIDVIDDEF